MVVLRQEGLLRLCIVVVMAALVAFSAEAFLPPFLQPTRRISTFVAKNNDDSRQQQQQQQSSSTKNSIGRTRSCGAHFALSLSSSTAIVSSSSDETECITAPRGSQNAWEVHKFGGASLATAELYKTVGDLLIKEAAGRGEGGIPTMA